ncbi:MAG: two-component regulator propeller domain-containing protein [Acidobacteriota bacterium]|nr:two-component regulator propeller domain-containing protein [Acidobacteriota bacterium]
MRSIFQDAAGYLWVGTGAGLNRFDGEQFKIFREQDGLQSEYINVLAEDDQGNLWIGTGEGLSRFDGKAFYNYSHKDGLPGKLVQAMVRDKRNRLWCGTDAGLVYVQDGKIVTPKIDTPITESISALFIDDRDRLWIGTKTSLLILEGNKVRPHPDGDLTGARVVEIGGDARGNVWIATERGVFGRKNGVVHTRYLTEEDDRFGRPTGGLLVDRRGVLWVGTNRGIMMIAEGRQKLLNRESGLPVNLVYTVAESRDGVLWFGGIPGMLALENPSLETIVHPNGPGNAPVRTVLRDSNDHIWVGSLAGLSRYDGENWDILTTEDGLNHEFLLSLCEDKSGVLWIGGRGGLNRIVDGRISDVAEVPHELSIFDVVVGPRGRLWISAMQRGIFVLVPDVGIEEISVPNQTFSRTRLLMDGANRLWASGDRGLSRWDGENWHTFTTDDGLAGERPYTLFEDSRGRIWFCYLDSRGVTVLENGSFRTLTTADGLADNAVFLIGEDRSGNIWLGSTQGVDRLGPEGITNFNVRDGLANNETNSGAFTLGPGGSLWFGTMGGLTRFHPDLDTGREWTPQPRIASVEMGGLPVKPGREISYKHSDFSAEIHLLNFMGRRHLETRVRLKGFSDVWQPLENQRFALTNLKPGPYTLEVESRFSKGPWSQAETFSFYLTPPPWETWWARLGGLLVIGLMIYFLVKVRIRAVENQKAELERLVAERTAALLAAQDELVQTAHEAGRADIAIGVLHNIGNLLSSVTTSAGMIREGFEKSNLNRMTAATSLLSEHTDDLVTFVSENPKGKPLINYLIKVEKMLRNERDSGLSNVMRLLNKIDVIRNYIMMHQDYVGAGFFEEEVAPAEVLEDAITLQAGSIERHGIRVVKHFDDDIPRLRLQKAKLINILINLYKNAREAMEEVSLDKRLLEISLLREGNHVLIKVSDNGCGIKPEHREKLFTQGFTSKKTGNGFGLHSCANYMKEMSGAIHAESEGEGKGSTFVLRFPVEKPKEGLLPLEREQVQSL